ncbi:DUF1521 domain-containing protein [Melittangium boletus]|uniref:DUF1521 domain-containing protein n=1 Tax=Melittangium boletus TaxID=83453 RepID=UPI003DA5D3A8
MSTVKDIGSGVRTLGNTATQAPLDAQAALTKAQDMLKDLTAQVATLSKNVATTGTPANTAATATAGATNTAAPTTVDLMFPSRSIKSIFDDVLGGARGPSTPSTPTPGDSSHPGGSLQTGKDGIITTPGGYQIQATSQFEWKITGPDGKSTRVWGDPHVDESDGGKWDFKRDSTFVLGDGTRINCSTTDYGNGMTVTKGLEIISGNDRVQVTDIDKGKGKTGAVTQDGYAHANSFGNKDVFVMGKETDDWSFTGKEIVGSNNGGESFKLGNALAAGTGAAKPANGTDKANKSFFDKLSGIFGQLSQIFDSLSKITKKAQTNTPFQPVNMQNRQKQLANSFQDIGRMLDLFSSIQNLNRSVNQQRFLTF